MNYEINLSALQIMHFHNPTCYTFVFGTDVQNMRLVTAADSSIKGI